MEIVLFILAVIVIGFFILPTSDGNKKWDNLTALPTKPPNCTCTHWTRFSFKLDYDCPVHGDWADH